MRHLKIGLIVFVATAACLLGCASSIDRVDMNSDTRIEIPFILTDQNNVIVSATLNGVDNVRLMLHTAATDVTITTKAAQRLKSIEFKDSAEVKSWGGASDSRYSQDNTVRIGPLTRMDVSIWEDINSGAGTDGKFGLDFFEGYIVLVDFDKGVLVGTKTLPSDIDSYSKIPIENDGGKIFITATCVINGTNYSTRFLMHSGYAGGLLLEDGYVAESGIDKAMVATDESSLKDSFGNIIKVRKGLLPLMLIGDLELQQVPTGFFPGQVGRQKMSVLGGAVLKQFNMAIDLSNSFIYLKPRESRAQT